MTFGQGCEEMPQSGRAEVPQVFAGNNVVEERERGPCVRPVLPVRVPTRDRGLGAAAEGVVRLMQGAPSLAFAPHFQVEQLSQVVAQSRNERGVLPARAVAPCPFPFRPLPFALALSLGQAVRAWNRPFCLSANG